MWRRRSHLVLYKRDVYRSSNDGDVVWAEFVRFGCVRPIGLHSLPAAAAATQCQYQKAIERKRERKGGELSAVAAAAERFFYSRRSEKNSGENKERYIIASS